MKQEPAGGSGKGGLSIHPTPELIEVSGQQREPQKVKWSGDIQQDDSQRWVEQGDEDVYQIESIGQDSGDPGGFTEIFAAQHDHRENNIAALQENTCQEAGSAVPHTRRDDCFPGCQKLPLLSDTGCSLSLIHI